jgi:hypothetical protein
MASKPPTNARKKKLKRKVLSVELSPPSALAIVWGDS